MNTLKIILLWVSFLILTSCNVGQSSVTENSSNLSGTIQIGHVNAIPYSAVVGDYVLLPITNNSNHTMSLSTVELISNNHKLAYNQYLDKTDCNTVATSQTCYLKIFANKHDGYLLNLGYTDNSQNTIYLKQIINFTNSLSEEKGVIVSSQENWVNHLSGLSIPIILNKSYNKLTATLGDLNVPAICSHSNSGAHNMCTILVPAMNISGFNNSLKITAVNENNLKSAISYSSTITLNKNISGNIVASAINPIISPADGTSPVSITLLNNGLESVTALSVSGVTPITLQNNNCTASLNTSQTCSFSINATSATSGQSTVIVSYTNASGTQVITLNVPYISKTASPLLTLTPNGSFMNVLTSSGYSYLTVNVSNNGNVALANLQFNNINAAKSNMLSFMPGTSCNNGGSLAVGSSCNMVLAYGPTSVESGTVKFILAGKYYNNNGESQTYSNSSLTIPYLAISNAVFKAVGDFGMVITSPAAGASGTWSANVNSPFSSTSISANKLLINNDTYVMTMSSGEIKYSMLKGLFWESSLLGGTGSFNASTCSVVYDGTYYYTCGDKNVSMGTPCTGTSGGCIVRTNNLGGGSWTRLINKSAADIAYFSNGTSKAYVATVPTSTANAGLTTSTDGLTWVNTSSSQSVAKSNNLKQIVYNEVSDTITVFNAGSGTGSTGVCSSSILSNVTSAWSVCTGSLPTDGIDAAVYGNGYYLSFSYGTGGAKAWTTSNNPNNGWTGKSVSALNASINAVIYANNVSGGIYFAAGDGGGNVITANPTTTWTRKADIVTGQNTKPDVSGLTYDGSNIWLTGVSTLEKSSNAESWVTPGLQSITKMGESYLAVDNQGNIFFSADSSKWQLRTNPTAYILNSVYCVAYNLCFAVGNNGTILKSIDSGTTWSQLSSSTSANLKKMTCNNGTCLIVGGSGVANSGTVLLSNDYTTWSASTSTLATTSLNDISYFNNSYLAIGNAGTIFTSPNGINNWVAVSSGTTQNLNSIACATSIACVAVGNAGTIRRSSSGASWTSATSTQVTNDILSVTYNGVFVIVGKGGVLRYSSDGTGGGSGTWYSATFPTTSSATNNLTAVISN